MYQGCVADAVSRASPARGAYEQQSMHDPLKVTIMADNATALWLAHDTASDTYP